MESLAEMVAEAAAGRPPGADGRVTVLPRATGGAVAAVVGFTAHHVVAADVDPEWVRARLPDWELNLPMGARFVAALADAVGAEPGAYDTVLVAPPLSVAVPGLTEVTGSGHRRVARAERYRSGVRAFAVPGGLLILGRGLAGRWEVAVEVEAAFRGRGLGRTLVAAAPRLVPPGKPLWAQVSPANVASLRAFLAAGYRPVAAEILFI